MMTSSNGNIFRVIGHLRTGEFPAQRPVTRSFHVFFDLLLNKPLSKHWWGWWFEKLSRPLWRHCDEVFTSIVWCGMQLSIHALTSTVMKLGHGWVIMNMITNPCPKSLFVQEAPDPKDPRHWTFYSSSQRGKFNFSENGGLIYVFIGDNVSLLKLSVVVYLCYTRCMLLCLDVWKFAIKIIICFSACCNLIQILHNKDRHFCCT